MRGGYRYSGSQPSMRSEYNDGYRQGYKHGWEDKEEDWDDEESYRCQRDSRGRYI